jgi:ribosomal protein L19
MEQNFIDGHQPRFKMKKYPLVHVSGLIKQKAYKFRAGYILRIVYSARNEAYIFNGICIAVRSGFRNPNLSLIVRNIILGVGIEMIFSYFGNRLFKLYIDFFKRKHRSLHRAKFFYIRSRINRSSRVKS